MEKEMKAIDIKGKLYIPVHERIRYFNENYPNGSIVTGILTPLDAKQIIIRAVITPDVSKPERVFAAHSQETVGVGYINETSAIENAETSAVGRALGMMGIGVDTSIASADEVVKAQNATPPPDGYSPEGKPLWVKTCWVGFPHDFKTTYQPATTCFAHKDTKDAPIVPEEKRSEYSKDSTGAWIDKEGLPF